ncbi:RimK family alpha-L-glutamate ligase [Vulgatibacter sp.]|uniref:RimK family alpha-L-glutamate ligase n=1 Tax=Vulgatibacter sp. TaxID=1971226 RepID=UPI00356ACCD4
MKIVVLSRKKSLYTTRRLVEAIKAWGHVPLVLDTLRCDLMLEKGRPQVFYEGKAVEGVGVVIPRIGASITAYGLAVVNQFDMMGVPVLNNSVPIARSRDKLRSLQLLARFGCDMPRTVMMRDRRDLAKAVELIGGLPVIVKLLQGTQGVGVMLAHTHKELQSLLDTMWTLDQEILLQEFIAESRGKDVRALVVGDRVVGAMRRVARVQGEFRSNIHRGGQGEPAALSRSYAEEAVRAARVMGLEVAGVDMLESTAGPKITEVNSSPGIEGLERATGIDVAGAIIAHAVEFARARASGWTRQRQI